MSKYTEAHKACDKRFIKLQRNIKKIAKPYRFYCEASLMSAWGYEKELIEHVYGRPKK